jgi:hypothetical protein
MHDVYAYALLCGYVCKEKFFLLVFAVVNLSTLRLWYGLIMSRMRG